MSTATPKVQLPPAAVASVVTCAADRSLDIISTVAWIGVGQRMVAYRAQHAHGRPMRQAPSITSKFTGATDD
jgi:hypothetical protein